MTQVTTQIPQTQTAPDERTNVQREQTRIVKEAAVTLEPGLSGGAENRLSVIGRGVIAEHFKDALGRLMDGLAKGDRHSEIMFDDTLGALDPDEVADNIRNIVHEQLTALKAVNSEAVTLPNKSGTGRDIAKAFADYKVSKSVRDNTIAGSVRVWANEMRQQPTPPATA